MSFELYVQSFKHGEPAGIPRGVIRAAFSGSLSEQERDRWYISYSSSDSCSLALSALPDSPGQVHNITVERPCSNPHFWRSLVALLSVGNTVLYFPGCIGPLLLNAGAAAHLPQDMLASLGEPIVVSDGAEILAHVRAAA